MFFSIYIGGLYMVFRAFLTLPTLPAAVPLGAGPLQRCLQCAAGRGHVSWLEWLSG